MNNSADNIIEIIFDILQEKFHVNKEICDEKYFNEPLTGKIFGFDAIWLTYLFFEIEKTFSIKIKDKYILDNKLNSINNIKSVIEQSAAVSI